MGTVSIPLTQGKVALIDEEDLPLIAGHTWCATRVHPSGRELWYAKTSIGRKTVYLHRLLMQPEPHQLIDHEDGDGLNCARSNMRIATRTQNQCNQRRTNGAARSGYRGVSFHRQSGLYHARVQVGGRVISVGYFRNPVDAAVARDAAAREHHGEFAILNFPIG